VPSGSPAARNDGTRAWRTIARAVANASDPMRNTTAFPVRTTPQASANTFGRPSNTNPTTPSGARHASTDHCGCSIRSITPSRRLEESRHPRRPPTMSARMRSSRTRRVVDRPLVAAAATSAAFASAIGANRSTSASAEANRSKKSVICSSFTEASSAKAWHAACTVSVTSSPIAAGISSSAPVDWTTIKRSPAANRPARSADTTVTLSPPNGISCPSVMLASARTRGCDDTALA